MKKIVATLSALALVVPMASAHAESISIEYSDLNLSSPEGQKQLERRIDAAARKVCELERTQTGTRIRNPDALACYEQAKVQAKRQLAAVIEREAKGG